jgi:dephospho-CoA kinase
MSEPIAAVISGQVSAGKTTAAKMLRNLGFQYARISQAIKKLRWDSEHGDKPSRSWYQETGMDLHRTLGQGALCKETMTFIRNPAAAFVIDGARWKEDVAFFRDRFGERVVHIHLTASLRIRKRRFEDREKDVSFEEADGHEVEREVPQLAEVADAIFDNSADDLSCLQAFLDGVLLGDPHAC